jgi:hypothetical protein
MKQKWAFLCCDEVISGFEVKMDTWQLGKPEAGIAPCLRRIISTVHREINVDGLENEWMGWFK